MPSTRQAGRGAAWTKFMKAGKGILVGSRSRNNTSNLQRRQVPRSSQRTLQQGPCEATPRPRGKARHKRCGDRRAKGGLAGRHVVGRKRHERGRRERRRGNERSSFWLFGEFHPKPGAFSAGSTGRRWKNCFFRRRRPRGPPTFVVESLSFAAANSCNTPKATRLATGQGARATSRAWLHKHLVRRIAHICCARADCAVRKCLFVVEGAAQDTWRRGPLGLPVSEPGSREDLTMLHRPLTMFC